MAKQLFPILGTDVPSMLGRGHERDRALQVLCRERPGHLSIVGPALSGKTVLMRHLADHFGAGDEPFTAVILWDIRHQTPESDEDFFAQLCDRMAEAFGAVDRQAYEEHIDLLSQHDPNDLREVMQDVAGDVCILVLLDGFDRAVSSGRLTRNLWDGLRELASLPSVRFVTSTRNTLRELIRTAESAASDFWNIFDPNPIRLGPFSEADQALIAESAGMRLGTGALSELANWSGGFPPLFLGILNEAITSEVAEIDNEAVNRLAEGSMEALDGVLNEIWDDCPEGARGLLVTLIGEGPKRDTGRLERRLLIERGLAQERSGEVRASCRLMCLHRENLEQDVGSLRRLFGVPADYEANARSMLDLRLMQASQVDEDLRQYVESCIQEAVRRPDACLYNLRGILDRALALIWAKELPNGEIPSHMRQHWESSGQDDQLRLVRVPEDRRRQIRLLQLLTGSAPGITAHASYVSKNTYTLITSLHGYANLGQHHEGTEVCATVAIVATHAAVELAHLLAAELG